MGMLRSMSVEGRDVDKSLVCNRRTEC